LPAGLTLREAMAVGTAGFTAALSVARLEANGLNPEDGPVLVTGASGGVGRTALGILAERGYECWAATGKVDAHGGLIALGAAGILTREEVTGESPRPLESERWAAAVDCVGAATLPYILRTLRWGALVMMSALRRMKIPAELHIVPEGGHGYGLRKGNAAAETWPLLAEKWLNRILHETGK
jgi:putative YhdH/YhfP family quinone oxidoreductase